jgi:hypothetical protein
MNADNGETSPGYGLWICAALCDHPELSWTEKALVARIDALTTDDRPCYASNEALAKMVNTSPKQINDLLSDLQKLGIIHRLGFHRTYAERVVTPRCSVNPDRSRRWIEGKPSFLENKNPKPQLNLELSLRENPNPSLRENPNPRSPAFGKTRIEPSGKPEPPILEIVKGKKRGGADAPHTPGGANSKARPEDQAEVEAFMLRDPSVLKYRLTAQDAESFWNDMESSEWRTARGPIKDWRAKVRTYAINGWLPSLRANPARTPAQPATRNKNRFVK